MPSDRSTAALINLLAAVRTELPDKDLTYTIRERSVTYYGDGLGRLIAATLDAEQAILEAKRVRRG